MVQHVEPEYSPWKAANARQLRFVVQNRRGTRYSYPYANVLQVKYSHPSPLTIHLTTCKVTIRGRKLHQLEELLNEEMASHICAFNAELFQNAPGEAAPTITRIRIEPASAPQVDDDQDDD